MKTKHSKAYSALSLVIAAAIMMAVLTSAGGGARAVTQSQIDALKQQQQSLENQTSALKEKMNSAKSDLSDSMAQKEQLDAQNTVLEQEIQNIDQQIQLYEDLIAEKEQELVAAKQAEEDQAKELRVRMRAMEENGTMSYLSILFKATSFTDFLSKLNDIDDMMHSDKELEDSYIAARQHVEDVKAEYEQTLADQQSSKTELEGKKSELEAQIDQANELIKELESDYESYKDAYDDSSANSAALDSQINSMISALESQQKTSTGTVVTGTGTYIWPLPGYSGQHTFGMRYHPILKYYRMHYGEDISAPTGTPILAADSGTVVTVSYEAGGYGNYVVINHGNGRSTRYAHMSAFAVSTGQYVTQGQVIGYVGSTGLSTGSHLHFETRVNGTAVDPYTYF